MPRGFSGLAGSSDVLALQEALTQLATLPRYSKAYPGPSDGVMRIEMLVALASVASELPGDKFPSSIKSTLSTVGPYLGYASAVPNATVQKYIKDALSAVERYASQAAVAVNFLAARGGAGQPLPANLATFLNMGPYASGGRPMLSSPQITVREKDGTFRVASPLAVPRGKVTHAEVAKGLTEAPAGALLVTKYPYLKSIGEYRLYKDIRIAAPAGVAVGGGVLTALVLAFRK